MALGPITFTGTLSNQDGSDYKAGDTIFVVANINGLPQEIASATSVYATYGTGKTTNSFGFSAELPVSASGSFYNISVFDQGGGYIKTLTAQTNAGVQETYSGAPPIRRSDSPPT